MMTTPAGNLHEQIEVMSDMLANEHPLALAEVTKLMIGRLDGFPPSALYLLLDRLGQNLIPASHLNGGLSILGSCIDLVARHLPCDRFYLGQKPKHVSLPPTKTVHGPLMVTAVQYLRPLAGLGLFPRLQIWCDGQGAEYNLTGPSDCWQKLNSLPILVNLGEELSFSLDNQAATVQIKLTIEDL